MNKSLLRQSHLNLLLVSIYQRIPSFLKSSATALNAFAELTMVFSDTQKASLQYPGLMKLEP